MSKVILLVDDDASMAEFIKISVAESGSGMDVRHAESAEAALEYLDNKAGFFDKNKNPAPVLMLLDLGLGKISGIEFLKQLKSQKQYMDIPIVILTATESPADLKAAYSNYANSCLVKPFGFEKTKELMKSVTSYWGNHNRLPE